MTDRFIEIINKEINKYFNCYYEEAPNTASFPYLVIPSFNLTPLNAGYNGILDIEIYVNEISDESPEVIMDTLRERLDNFSYIDNTIAFHIGFDNQYLVKSNEQDLTIRRITFTARIFK